MVLRVSHDDERERPHRDELRVGDADAKPTVRVDGREETQVRSTQQRELADGRTVSGGRLSMASLAGLLRLPEGVDGVAVDAIDCHLGVPRGFPLGDVAALVAAHADLSRRLTPERADRLRISRLRMPGAVSVARLTARRWPQVRAFRVAGDGPAMAGQADLVLGGLDLLRRRVLGARQERQGQDEEDGESLQASHHASHPWIIVDGGRERCRISLS